MSRVKSARSSTRHYTRIIVIDLLLYSHKVPMSSHSTDYGHMKRRLLN